MKNVLLAGANGVIGFYIYKNFKNFFSIFAFSKSKNFQDENIIQLDLNKKNDLKKFTKNCLKFDVLMFFIGLAHKKGEQKEFSEFEKNNLLTLKNLLSLLKRENKVPLKIIYTSSISVYGEKMKSDYYSEEAVTSPESPYAVTKLKAENYLLRNYPEKSWILRLAPIYSNKFNLNIDRRTKLGRTFFKVGDGSNRLSLCHIDNVRIVLEAIIYEKLDSGVYNVSDNKEYSYNDLLAYNKSTSQLKIPQNLLYTLYWISVKVKCTYFKENLTKLLSDNIYPSNKIQKYIKLPNSMNNVK